MNRSKIALLVVFAVCAATVAEIADARRYHRHRPHIGVFVGAPLLFAPFYAYPRYYYPGPAYYPAPVAAYPSSPPVYIEQSQSAVPQAQGSGASWYYCADSQTYYPYVQQCASPWQQVAPQSVPPS